jgi:hypothetical protein
VFLNGGPRRHRQGMVWERIGPKRSGELLRCQAVGAQFVQRNFLAILVGKASGVCTASGDIFTRGFTELGRL